MSSAKFLSLLNTSSLWFARADQFKDMFEGSSPKINVEARQPPAYLSEEDIPVFRNLMENTAGVKRQWIKHVAINCWQMASAESVAMWDIYLPNDKDGVAIQSTYRRLKDSLRTDEPVYIGKVKYIDYEHQVIESDSVLAPFIHKRKAYEYERELRAVIVRSPPTGPRGLDFSIETIQTGILIPVDLRLLITKILLPPQAPASLTGSVKSLIAKHGYNFDVMVSSLSGDPQF